MGPSSISVRAFLEQVTRWVRAVEVGAVDDAKYHADEVAVVGRMIASTPGFKRSFADRMKGSRVEPEQVLDQMSRFLGAMSEWTPDGSAAADGGLNRAGDDGAAAGTPEVADGIARSHLVWSAVQCTFPKAGVYYGLAPSRTLCEAAAWLLPRRGVVHLGAQTEVRPGTPWPLMYFAVRDPSAVRVVPVRGRGGQSDMTHVSLVLRMDARETGGREGGAGDAEAAALEAVEVAADRFTQAGFVMSIGLKKEREREFQETVLLAKAVHPFSELCGHIQDAAERFGG